MHDRACGAWLNAGMAAWALGAEASLVIGLRLGRMAMGGPTASAEGQLMISEKFAALAELQAELAAEALGMTPLLATTRAVSHYRRKVAANRRRLLREA